MVSIKTYSALAIAAAAFRCEKTDGVPRCETVYIPVYSWEAMWETMTDIARWASVLEFGFVRIYFSDPEACPDD